MAQQQKVPAGISSLLESGEYSDLKLQCGDRMFSVHRSIVCSQSESFAKACKGPFKEAESGVIDLVDENPDIVERALRYFYFSDYDYDSARPGGDGKNDEATITLEAQLLNVAMFALADRWFVHELQALAVEKFNELAKQLELWIHGVPEVLRAIYTTTPARNRLLRDRIVRLCAENNEDLPLFDPENGIYHEVLTQLADAHVNILKATLAEKEVAIAALLTSHDDLAEKLLIAKSERDLLRTENTKLNTDLLKAQKMPTNWALMCLHLNDLLHNGCSICPLNRNHYSKIL